MPSTCPGTSGECGKYFYPDVIDNKYYPGNICLPFPTHRPSRDITMTYSRTYTAFFGESRIAAGSLPEVAREVWRTCQREPDASVLVFDDNTSRQAELDLRGSMEDVVTRLDMTDRTPLASPKPRGRGRPKLGVVPREVTLLPRHWEWLGSQPGGASAALRRLVEDARRGHGDAEKARQSGEAVYRFMSVMGGNREGFEEALRAFYRSEKDTFRAHIATWPKDIRAHLQRLAAMAWDDQAAAACT